MDADYFGLSALLPILMDLVHLTKLVSQFKFAKAIGSSSDGWTTLTSHSVHNLMICNPNPYFYHAKVMGTEEQSANNLVALFEESRKSLNVVILVFLLIL